MMTHCVVCGKEFEKRGKVNLCSDECRAERRRGYDRKHKTANREKLRQRYRKWYAANREKKIEQVRQYHAAHPEKVRERKRKDYKARSSASGGAIGMRPIERRKASVTVKTARR